MEGERYDEAIRRFDQENAADPRTVIIDGDAVPRELYFARKLTEWILRLEPGASEVLRLAARCQHLCRWKIPRSDYPLDHAGYHRWRTHLKKFHADLSGKILAECGYDSETVRRVQELNLKKNFPEDLESRVLEDGLCLVFLETQLDELAARTDREKILNALKKSWGKMTKKGRQLALGIPFKPFAEELVRTAISEQNTAS